MNSDQIKLLRDSYMVEATRPDGRKSTAGEYMRFLLDGGIDFVTSKDLVIFDDTNDMLHCMCVNDDARSQANFPIKVMSSEYGMVQQVETIMSQENFEKFLEDGFLSSMTSDAQKEAILKWSKAIKNQALQPMDPEPAWRDTVHENIIPMPNTQLERQDYIPSSVFTIDASGKKVFYNSIDQAIANVEDGGRLTLVGDVVTTNTIVLDTNKEITVDLNGASIHKAASGDGTSEPLFKVTDGTLNVVNTHETEKGYLESANDVFYVAAEDGKTPIINIGSDIDIDSGECCVLAKGTSTVNIGSADLTSTGTYATIQGNGSTKNAGTTINIDGAVIKNNMSHAIYHPQDGVLNIKSAHIEGTTAIYSKAGIINVSKTRLLANGAKGEYTFNGNGACDTGDAIVADFCDYPGGKPTISISDSYLESDNGYSIGVYNKNGERNIDDAIGFVIINEDVTLNDVELRKYCADGIKLYVATDTTFVSRKEKLGEVIIERNGEAKQYNTIAEAFEDVMDGDEINLGSGEVLADTLNLNNGANITLKLNSDIYSTAKTFLNIINGSVTISGHPNSIICEGIGVRVNGEAEGVKSKLVIDEGVEIISKESTPVFPTGNAEVIIKGTIISQGIYAGIQGNGNTGKGGTSIIVDGGKIISNDVGIYNPQIGSITITNDAIVEGSSGIYIKCGTLNVEGGVIRGVGAAIPYKYNGSGADSTGDGIIADFCDYPGGMPTVNISGGTISSINASAFETYDKDGVKNPVAALGNVHISGGRFSTTINASYIEDGYKLYHNSDETYSVVSA